MLDHLRYLGQRAVRGGAGKDPRQRIDVDAGQFLESLEQASAVALAETVPGGVRSKQFLKAAKVESTLRGGVAKRVADVTQVGLCVE